MVEARIKKVRRIWDVYSTNDLQSRIEAATAALKADICWDRGGEAGDPRLRVLDNTRRLNGCFLLWQGHYIGEIQPFYDNGVIYVRFIPFSCY